MVMKGIFHFRLLRNNTESIRYILESLRPGVVSALQLLQVVWTKVAAKGNTQLTDSKLIIQSVTGYVLCVKGCISFSGTS